MGTPIASRSAYGKTVYTVLRVCSISFTYILFLFHVQSLLDYQELSIVLYSCFSFLRFRAQKETAIRPHIFPNFTTPTSWANFTGPARSVHEFRGEPIHGVLHGAPTFVGVS